VKVLYIDCFSGVAGDMMLGALLDLGVDEQHLRAELAKLKLDGWELSVSRALRHGISGVDVQVVTEHHHHHDGGDHDDGHHHDHHHGRRWAEIRTLIQESGLADDARALALDIFTRLALAEARLHDVEPDTIHFHEVGGVDAIIDICGAAIGLCALGVERIIAAPVPAPRGFVDCAHGRMPLPAPATMELLKGAVLQSVDSDGEWVTPTGAAIVTTTASEYGPIPAMRVDEIGYGVGDWDPADRPNLLRLVLGEVTEASGAGRDLLLEANIDDMTPELFGHVTETLLTAGAYDVWLTPIQMKKGRPGIQLSVLCAPARRAAIVDTILRESTTIGLRFSEVQRYKTVQSVETVATPFGPVKVKIARDGDRVINAAPEYEDCRRAAEQNGVPLKQILQQVQVAVVDNYLSDNS